VAQAILEDVELAKRVKQEGHLLRFRQADVLSTRMYRSFPQMWEGWTKNLALLFPHPRKLALTRLLEFAVIVTGAALTVAKWMNDERAVSGMALTVTVVFAGNMFRRIRKAHFGWTSNILAVFGLPLFAILLLNSDISHRRGSVSWKGREYRGTASITRAEGPHEADVGATVAISEGGGASTDQIQTQPSHRES
jgi:hypothetical protein